MRFLAIAISFVTMLSMSCESARRGRRGPPGGVPPRGPIGPLPPPVPPQSNFVSFNAFESDVLSDLTTLNSARQENARFITLCDQLNANNGTIPAALKRGVEKGINQLSTEVDIEAGQWIGSSQCTLRIDQRDYGLTPVKWRLIEAEDPLQFESFTDRGILIKQLTQARRSWIHGTNFLEATLTDDLYYDLVGVPDNLQGFIRGFAGCDLQRDFDDFDEDLFVAGVRRSRIALQKNRSVYLTDCANGPFAGTYDTVSEDVTSAGRNLSINPFPIEARTNNTFQHDAQEFIFTLENGLQGYALFNSAGVREVCAPTNVVTDPGRAGIQPDICNARSCSSCHAKGMLEANDFIASHVTGNPNFSADEIQKAQAYFGRQQGFNAAIGQANRRYQLALSQLNIDANIEDPINQVTDKIREEMAIKAVAGMLFLQEQEFRQLLPQSPQGQLAIGQLLSGGSINFQDLVQVKDILVNDLNLFQERLGE